MSLPRADSSRGVGAFDKFEFQNAVKEMIPDDLLRSLQEKFGLDMAAAVECYESEHRQKGENSVEEEQPGDHIEAAGRRMFCYRDQIYDKYASLFSATVGSVHPSSPLISNRPTRKWIYKPVAKKSNSSNKHRRYVLIIRRVYSAENHLFSHTIVEVRGNYLRGFLRKIFHGSAGFSLTDTNTELEHDKVHFLFWARRELALLQEYFAEQQEPNAEDNLALFEVEAALRFINEEWGYMISILQSNLPYNISFEYLWAILPPDSLVVNLDVMNNKRIFHLRSHKLQRTQEGGTVLKLLLEYADFDHKRIGAAHTSLEIPAYDGLVGIQDLPVVPFEFYPDLKTLKAEVLLRTSKQLRFYEDKRPKVQQHSRPDNSGIGLTEGSESLRRLNFRGRLIVDIETLSREEPDNALLPRVTSFPVRNGIQLSGLEDCSTTDARNNVLQRLLKAEIAQTNDTKPAPKRRSRYRYSFGDSDSSRDSMDTDTDSNPEDVRNVTLGVSKEAAKLTLEQRLLFPGRVYGYSLGDEMWGAFSVNDITDIKWDDNIWNSLVMEADMKDTLFGLIETHVRETSGFDDFVKGKGKGLVGLLSGPPGAGKTLTAEAVAEKAQKPLYMVSSGSLGSTATTVGESLSRILQLANHWGAVVLLDEADVFLARRSLQDLERNAVVSVFLRELEYYPGILLLTTNLPDILDEAFESRIHFFHHYMKLDEAGRETVWREFARAVTGITINIDEAGYKKIRQLELNGRQIKNVMSISVKLAISKNEDNLSAERIVTTARTLQKNRGAAAPIPGPKPKIKPSHLTGERTARMAASVTSFGETQRTE